MDKKLTIRNSTAEFLIFTSQAGEESIEVKFKENLKSSDFSGLKNFFNFYDDTKKGFLINLGKQTKENKIKLVLPYVLLKEIFS